MVTQKDIAKVLNMPRATVSAALNDIYKSKSISSKRRALIKKTAKDMGYVVDDIARIVKTGKSNIVAFVSDMDFGNDIELFNEFLKFCTEAGYFVKNIFRSPDMTNQDIVDVCLRQRIAGVACRSMLNINELQVLLAKNSIPLAVVDYAKELNNGIHIVSDIHASIDSVVSLLSEKGYKNFAYGCQFYPRAKAGEEMEFWAQKWYKSLCDSFENNNIDFNEESMLFYLPVMEDKDYHDFFEHHFSENVQTVMLCETYNIAYTVCYHALRYGIKIPEKFLVVSFGKGPCNVFKELITLDLRQDSKGKALAIELLKELERNEKRFFDNKRELVIPSEIEINVKI